MYKVLATILHIIGTIAWFAIVLDGGTIIDVLAVIGLLGVATAVIATTLYFTLAQRNRHKIEPLLEEHPSITSAVATFLFWMCPALIQGPWISAAALTVAAAFIVPGSFFIRKWADEENRKRRMIFEDF